MSYSLTFTESALKEWHMLTTPVRQQFKKKLAERLEHPCVPKARLRHLPDCYKIKLRSAGFRMVYEVDEAALVITVIAVGKRDRNAIYRTAQKRIKRQ